MPLRTGETGRSPFPYRERSSRPVQAALWLSASLEASPRRWTIRFFP